MKITKNQLRRIIREEAMNEGIWDSIKSAVGIVDPADAGLEVQQVFEKMGEGVNAMLRLAAKGSQMAKYWESYTGGTRPEALMRGNIPSEYYRSSNQGGYGNILNSIGKFQDHFYDSLWNALAGAAPDAHGELDSIFRELASKPSRRSANKLRDVGVKIKDEALSSGDEDSLVEFNKLLKQWAGEQINQTSFDANAWFEEHQGSFGLGESAVRITRKQLRRIIKESLNEVRPHRFDSEGYEMTSQAATDKRIYDAVIDTLELSAELGGGSMPTAQIVMSVNHTHPDIDPETIHSFLDELASDGEIAYDPGTEDWRLQW